MDFNGRVAVVTGAGQGLGAALAKEFAAHGASVALIGRTQVKLDHVVSEIKESGADAEAFCCDIACASEVEETFQRIVARFGKIDILVNNAAIHKSLPLTGTSVKDWDEIIRTNLNGTFYCISAVIQGMIDQRYGKIVNISSNSVKHYFPGFGAYATSKGGMIVMTQILSEEVKQYGVQVNAINLGMTNTEKTRERFGSNDPAVKWSFSDMLQAEDAARAIAFIASDEGAPFVGAVLDMDGPIR